MALTIVHEPCGARPGIYIGGFNIAPDGLLIVADHWGAAWEAMVDHYADAGELAECWHATDGQFDACDAHDYGSSGGPYVTLDLVMRVVRPGRGD